jgi:hypothetical protein
LDFDLSPVPYDGTPHPVDVNLNSPYTDQGVTVTVKYNGNVDPPVDAGTYDVTMEVTGATNFRDTTLKLGSFTITKAPPEAATHLDFDLSPVPYDGTPQGIAVPTLNSPYTDTGATVTVKYNGNADLPVDAGTYAVTVDIENSQNFDDATLTLGDFIITPAPLTITPFGNQTKEYG